MTDITTSGFAVWNGDDSGWEAIDEACVLHDADRPEPVVGRGAIRARVAEYRAAAPDLRVEPAESIAEGDLVATRWTATSGGTVVLRGISLGRTRDGRLVESWIVPAGGDGAFR